MASRSPSWNILSIYPSVCVISCGEGVSFFCPVVKKGHRELRIKGGGTRCLSCGLAFSENSPAGDRDVAPRRMLPQCCKNTGKYLEGWVTGKSLGSALVVRGGMKCCEPNADVTMCSTGENPPQLRRRTDKARGRDCRNNDMYLTCSGSDFFPP